MFYGVLMIIVINLGSIPVRVFSPYCVMRYRNIYGSGFFFSFFWLYICNRFWISYAIIQVF